MATGLENLWIYKLAEDLEIEVHEITKNFPRDEFYRSVDQLRRSSASVANVIAETYHKTSNKEKIRFLDIASGEAEETKRNLIKSARKDFISKDKCLELADKYTVLLKGIYAFKRFLKTSELKPITKLTKTKN
ncbi:MAG: four helix bundle protein [bacterium]|nr:four helix bundle protein [bacterium]